MRRHQPTGAVIARCGQPEVSWWGWRNADDEHLVQSIAKACAVDGSSRKHLSNGGYANGHDLPDTDFGESSHAPRLRPPPQTHSHTDVFTAASVGSVPACVKQPVHTWNTRISSSHIRQIYRSFQCTRST